MILGHGNKSCGTWLQNRGSQSYAEAAQLSWVWDTSQHSTITPSINRAISQPGLILMDYSVGLTLTVGLTRSIPCFARVVHLSENSRGEAGIRGIGSRQCDLSKGKSLENFRSVAAYLCRMQVAHRRKRSLNRHRKSCTARNQRRRMSATGLALLAIVRCSNTASSSKILFAHSSIVRKSCKSLLVKNGRGSFLRR